MYIRLRLNMYTNHVTCALWNGICSRPFAVGKGVKQGGVISPTLFCIYIDSLLGALQNSAVGCYIGCMFLRAVAMPMTLCCSPLLPALCEQCWLFVTTMLMIYALFSMRRNLNAFT